MTTLELCPCRRFGLFSALILISMLALSLPLVAAGPAPAQAAPSGPRIWLQENQPLPVIHRGAAAQVAGQAQPVSITSGDLDVDGFDDLIVGYRTSSGGFISVHRGNIDAFAPQSDASFQAIARGEFPSPFLLEAQTFNVSISPDFVAVGNFIGNGNMDLAVAAKGGSVLYLFPGDGKGGFGDPQTVNLGGGVDSLAVGELSSAHIETLIIGTSNPGKNFSLTVYVSTPQGLTALASYALAAPASNILFGDFGDPGPDAAFLAGGRIQILRSSTMQLTGVSLPVQVRAFALGSFIFDRNGGSEIAFVAPDGSVQIAARNDFDPRAYTLQEFSAIRQARMTRQPVPSFVPQQSFPADGWRVVESFPGAAAMGNGQAPVMFRTRASSSGADDVMVLNAFSGVLALISHPDLPPGAQTFLPGRVSLRPYSGSPVTAIPMRINVDGRPGVMAIHQGEIAPSMIMPIPDPTFTVNTTSDIINSAATFCASATPNKCSLRQAVFEANAAAGTDTIMIPAGTYTLTIPRAASPVYDAKTGTLDVTDSVNIIGAGQATTIIQGGTVGVTPGPPNGVDKVFSFNQDITAFTNATVNLSNVTIQNGFNRGNTIITDGWGGAFDFDTGTNGTANLTVTDVTLNNNTLTDGEGGGFAIFNTNNSTGGATFSNCTVQNNIIQPNSVTVGASTFIGSANGGGGFVASPANMTMTNCAVKNNQANSANGHNPVGGGFEMLLAQAGSPAVKLHATTVSGNQAGGLGGGIYDTAPLTIDQGSMIINNTAGKGGVASNLDGGGLWFNSANSSSITKSTFTGNQADTSAGKGGGIFVNGTAGGALSISFSRFASNSAKNGTNMALSSGAKGVTAQDNWWGTNTANSTLQDGAGANPTSHCTPGTGQICFDPFIVLTHTASPNLIRIGDISTLTADFLHDNHGTAITASNLDVFSGLPITFNNANHGTISNAQPFIEGQVNISTVSETGCASPPVVPCTATVTVTTSTAHGFSAGQTVTIAGVTDPSYDGMFTIVSTPTTTTFTYSTSNTATTSSSGGTAGVPKGTATATYTATSGGIDQVHATVDGFAASATVTVLFPPQISKQFSVTNIPIFTFSPTTAQLTFTITNPNTANALHGLAFTDNLPSGLQIADTTNTNGCGGTLSGDTAGSTSISYSGGTISFNAGGTFTCTVTVDVKGVTDGVQNNTSGNVTATDAGGLTGNFATASITVINPPSITKAFTLHSIPLNGSTTLTFTLSNSNANTTLNGIAFNDALPSAAPGTLIVSTPSNLNSTCSGTPSASPGSGTVSLTGATLAPGTSCTVTVSVTGTVAGSAPNSVTPTATNVGGLTGPASSDTVLIVAPPTIAKSFSPKSVPLNSNSTLSFTLTNPNTGSALSGIAFTDSLPGGVKLASTTVTGSCGSGTITATINNPPGSPSTVSLSGGTLTASPAAGSSCTFSVSVTGITAGAQVNTTSTVSSTEGGTGSTATDTLTVVAPPTINKSFSPKSVPLNSNSTLSFTVTNPNTASALSGVAFTDSLPAGTKLASTSVTGSCGSGTITATINNPPGSPSTVSLSGGTLTASPSAGSSCTFSVSVTGISAGSQVNTTGTVSSTEGGTGGTASDTLTVVAPPTINKSFSPKSVPLNGNSTLSFTVTNPNTLSALSGVAFTDSLPAGTKLASTTVTGSCGSGTITATINNPPGSPSTVSLSGGTLTASPSAGSSCTFSVSVTGISAGSQVNTTGTVSSTEGGTGGTASDTLTVVAPPTISKHFGHTTVPLNQSDTLSFTVTNPNTLSGLSGVAFTDSLPGGLKLASTTVTGSCGSGTITATINNPPGSPSTVSLSGGTLTASPSVGSSCTFSVSITGISAGAQVNTTSTVSSTEGGTGSTATDTITVVAPPTTTKAFNPTTISVGGTSTMTITITNPSATVGLTGVGFTDTFPANLVVATPNGLTNTCNGTPSATAGSGTVSLTGGTIAANSSCAVTVKVTSSTSGVYLNSTGTISSTEGGNGTAATATLTVASPPTISKSFSPKSIPLNGSSTLSFTLTNPNSNVALSGIAFTDSLPGGVKLASTTVIGSCGSGTITATINNPPGSPSTVSLSGGTLASSGSCTFSVSVTGISAGAQVNTTSTVSSTEGGTGSTATDTLTVIAPPTISKHFGHTTVPLNQSDTLSFTVTNPNTTSALSGVAFTDSLPGGLTLASTTVTGSCGSGTITATINNPPGSPSTVSLSGGTLTASPGAGSSCTFSVSITGISAGAQVNTTSTVSSTEGGTGSTATDTITVVAPPTTTKMFIPTTISVGGTSTMTITIANPSATVGLTGVGFTDTFPANLVVATPNGLSNTCNGTPSATAGSGTVSLTGGTIAANSSCTVTVNVTSSVSGNYLNSTGAISSTEGGNGAAATATLTVASPPTISKSFSPNNIPLNGNSTLSFTLTNPNNNVTLSGIAFTDSLPGGVELASTTVTGSCGSGTITATINNPPGSPSTVSLSGGTLASSGSCTFSVSVTGISAGAQVNTTSTVSSTEGGTGSTATDTLTVVAPPTISKSFSPPGTVMFDGITTVTFTINNPNTTSGGDLTGIGFTDTLPSSTGTLVVAPTPNVSTTCGGGTGIVTATAGSGVITVSGGSLAHNSSCTISVDLQATAVGDASNTTGAITSTEGGTGATSNTAPMTVIQASTTTTVTADQGTITLGDTVTFTATVTASGGTATGIVTFFDGNTPLGSARLNGTPGNDQATFPTSLLSAAGSPHSITAIYQGSTDFAVSPLSSPISETVNPRNSTTGVALNPTTVVVGQSSTLTVTVTDSGSVPPGTADTFSSTGAPLTGRTGFTATLIADGAVLITGGTDANNNVLNSAEVYAGGTFSATPGNLNAARTGAVAVLLPTGKVLVAGGSSDGTGNGALNSAELLDPNTGTFTPTSHNMTAARFGATITLLNTGKVLIAGGQNSGGVLNSAELYDPAADTFTASGNLNAARTGASATLLGTGKVLVAGGSSDGTANGALNSAEVFDPAGNSGAGTFASVAGANPTLSDNRWQPEAALLLSGKVLIAGGQNNNSALASADLYDPAADSFTASSQSMSQVRANGSAVTLPSGMVLLAGGTTSQAVDLYDADSDRFNTTGSLVNSDAGLVSTLLNNGQVLVVGLTTAATPASDAELYSPSFNPLGTLTAGAGLSSSEATDSFGPACVLVPSNSTASTCTSSVTPSNVATSPHTITATYPADAVHSGSNNNASLTVNKADTTTTITGNTPNPSAVNQAVLVSVQVTANSPGSGTPTGTVTVSDGVGETCTITLSSGTGSCSITPVAAGTDTLTATYAGDANFNGSISAGVSQTVVGPPSISKAFSPNAIPLNGTSTLTFTITNPPANTVAQSGVAFSDTLPAGLVVSTPNGLTDNCGGTASATAGGTSISLTGGSIPVNSSCTVVVNITGTAGGSFTNTSGAVSSTNGGTGNTASDTLTVVAPPSIAKAFNPNSVPLNGTSTLTFTITNPAANTVAESGVAFTDTLPAGLVVATPNGLTDNCGGTASATAGGTSISLTGGSIPVNSSCTVVVNVTGTTAGSFTNTSGAVSSTNGGTGNTASDTLTVVAPPVIAKAFNPNGIPVNGTSALTFTITNPAANTVAEQGVAFTDSLPSGVVVATPNGLSNTCGGTPTATAGSGTISLTGGTVAVNSNCTLTVNVTSSQAGVYTNTSGNVSSTNGGTGNTASDTLTVAAPPTIVKAFGASAVAQNSTVGVSFTISNSNTSVTLTGISFTDTLPAGLVVATPNGVTDTCGGTVTAVSGSSTISFTGGSLAPAGPPPIIKTKRANINVQSNVAQGTCVITVNLLVTGTGTLSNTTGPISANESGPGTVSNTATLEVVQPPTVNKAFGAASIPLNGTTSLTFNIANPNSSTALVGIALNDPLLAGLVVANPNGLTGSCVASSVIAANPGSSSINLSSLNLPASGSCSFSVNVTGTTAGTKNNATSNITATFDDGAGTFLPVTGGAASASIFVVAPPVISKFFLPAAIAPNGIAALTFGITNPSANTVAETGVAFTDTLPANVVVATPNGLSGSCGGTVTAVAGTGVISLTGGTIPPGSSGNSCSFTVNVTSSVIGSFTNTTGPVSSTNGGTGNTASATLTVAHANLSITKTHSGNFPRNSTGNNYTIVVSNAAGVGPTDGTTVTVTDTLPNVPNTLVPTAMSGTGWTCNLGTLTCTRTDVLAPGGSYPAITLTVTVPQNIQANVTNSATVSGGGDPNSHTANDPTHIGPPIEITSNLSSLTVSHNNPSSLDFTVNASPGMGTITFSCSGMPFDASCIFNPPSENQLSATVTMTVITAGNHARLLPPGGPNSTPPIYALLFPLLGLLGLRGWNGRRIQSRKAVRVRIAMAFAGLLLLLALAGCGGGTGFTGTPGGTFQIQVTATSQSTGQSGSTTVTLTVLD